MQPFTHIPELRQVKPYKLLAATAAATISAIAVLGASAQATDHSLNASDFSASSPIVKQSSVQTPDAAERFTVPGTSVSLIPPLGFVGAEQFSGLSNPDNRSSIVLSELPLEQFPPTAYSELVSTLFASPEAATEAFAGQGVTLDIERISNISVGDTQVPFAIGTQVVQGIAVKKYFTLLQSDRVIILITFNLFESAQLTEEAVVETIQSVRVAAAPSTEEKVAALPFTFEAASPFQVAEVLVGSGVALTPNGELNDSGQPLIIITSSLSPVDTSDLSSLAAQLLRGTTGFANASITAQEPINFAGGQGYVTRALAEGATVIQYLGVLPDGFYIRLIAVGESEALEAVTPAIEAIQTSVEAKQP